MYVVFIFLFYYYTPSRGGNGIIYVEKEKKNKTKRESERVIVHLLSYTSAGKNGADEIKNRAKKKKI